MTKPSLLAASSALAMAAVTSARARGNQGSSNNAIGRQFRVGVRSHF